MAKKSNKTTPNTTRAIQSTPAKGPARKGKITIKKHLPDGGVTIDELPGGFDDDEMEEENAAEKYQKKVEKQLPTTHPKSRRLPGKPAIIPDHEDESDASADFNPPEQPKRGKITKPATEPAKHRKIAPRLPSRPLHAPANIEMVEVKSEEEANHILEPGDKWFTVPQAAKLCGMSHTTYYRWIHEGILKAYIFKIPNRINRDRMYRVKRSEVNKFLSGSAMTVRIPEDNELPPPVEIPPTDVEEVGGNEKGKINNVVGRELANATAGIPKD